MKILLAVDGSKYTKKMLAYLVTHDEVYRPDGNEYVLFTAHPALPPRARAALGKAIADNYHQEEAQKVLEPAAKFLARHGIEARTLWKVGSAGDLIADTAADGKFDLVMLGSHGHRALANLVLGSVATQVLANCKVPVLLVR